MAQGNNKRGSQSRRDNRRGGRDQRFADENKSGRRQGSGRGGDDRNRRDRGRDDWDQDDRNRGGRGRDDRNRGGRGGDDRNRRDRGRDDWNQDDRNRGGRGGDDRNRRDRGRDDRGRERQNTGRAKSVSQYLVIPGRQPVLEALKANRNLIEIFVDTSLAGQVDDVVALAEQNRVPVVASDRDKMDRYTDGVRHQGVLATTKWPSAGSLDDHLNHKLVVILDGVTDPRNLGAIARSAEQAGAGCLVVRDRRAAGYSPAAEKASAGALSWLPVVTVPNIVNAVKTLHDAGMWTVGLAGDDPNNLDVADKSDIEQRSTSTNRNSPAVAGNSSPTLWEQPLLDERVAIVIGEEGDGISRLVLENVDGLVSIPMFGHLDSLNASTAAAITLFEIVRRNKT